MGSSDRLKVTRRAVLAAGAGTVGLSACRGGSSSSGASPSMPAPQWLASKELVPFAQIPDMAALNKAAGLTTRAQRSDPYGPYLPLSLPKGHPIYTSAPADPDPKALASQPMSAWRTMLATAAAPFVTYMVDPDILWSHDKNVIDTTMTELVEIFLPPNAGTHDEIKTMFGQETWLNTDGKLLTRIGGTPLPRTTPGPRFGVVKLDWTALTHEGRPALALDAILHSPAVSDGVTWEWGRAVRMIVPVIAPSDQNLQINFPHNDQLSAHLRDPLHDLPHLVLGAAPTGWSTQHLGKLTYGVPAGWKKTTSPEDAPGTVRFALDGQYMTVQTFPSRPVEWFAVKGDTNTQFQLADGTHVLADWGHDTDTKTYLAVASIYAPTALHLITFTTTPEHAPQDLRTHAATWHTTT